MESFILNWAKEIWFIQLTSVYRVAMAGALGAAGAEDFILGSEKEN